MGHHHSVDAPDYVDEGGITRSVVIGDDLWTVSDAGLMVTQLATLTREPWIAYGRADFR